MKKNKTSVKHYTYDVLVSFKMQFTFSEKEVQSSEEEDKNVFDPSDEALTHLEKELKEFLSQKYPVDEIEAWVDFDGFLGANESSD